MTLPGLKQAERAFPPSVQQRTITEVTVRHISQLPTRPRTWAACQGAVRLEISQDQNVESYRMYAKAWDGVPVYWYTHGDQIGRLTRL